MEENKKEDVATVSLAAFEAAQDRWMKAVFYISMVCIALAVGFIGTNVAWMVYENSMEDTTITQEVSQDSTEGGTNTNILYGGDYNGETDGEDNNPYAK